MIYTLLNEIFFPAVEALMIMLLVLLITNRRNYLKVEKVRIALFVVLYTTFSYFASYYLPMGYHTVFILAFVVGILSPTIRLSIRNAAISFAIIFIFMILTELSTAFIFSAVSNTSITEIVNSPLQKVMLSTAVKVVQFMIVALLYGSSKSYFKSLSTESEDNIVPYFLFGICLMGLFVININYAVDSGGSIYAYQLLLIAILLLYIFLGIKIIKEKEQLLKIHHKYRLQEVYVSNIETLLNVVRREKHDFSNHINTIYAICMLNKPDAIERIKVYIDRLTCNLQSSYHYYNTGNDYVDGLLAVKSNFAFDHDIHLEVDFEALLDDVMIDSYDLISIMGNIIDNAFTAVLLNPEQEKRIVSVASYLEDDQYYLSITNNGPVIPKEDLERIFSNGFSTKENNKDDHGLGLFIVKQLILRNHGNISVSSGEDETEFSIKFDRRSTKDGEIGTASYQLNTSQ